MESDSIGWRSVLASAPAAGVHFGTRDWILLGALLLLLLLAAIAAAAETALTSVNRIRIRTLAEEGDAKAQRIERLLARPQLLLTTILVVSNVTIITASTLATIIAVDLNFTAAEVVSTVVLSLVVLIFCDITPKSAAIQASDRWARALVGPVARVMTALMPLVRALTWIATHLVGAFGGQVAHLGPFVTENELRRLVEVSEEEGVIQEDEREMIDNVFELGDTTVREVMVPRIDMVAIAADATIEEATQLMLQGGQSRIPVYDQKIDDIIGLLYAKDLLQIYAASGRTMPTTVRSLVRNAYFVPESKRADDLLRELQQQRVHMAIVMDEYGQVAGIVTIEDVVEEIIGDIKDEYDVEEQVYEHVGENEFIIDARLSLDEFEEVIGRKLPEDGYDTVGGFVYAQLDKIPSVGDTIHYEDMAITVLNTKGRRVTKIKVVRGLPSAVAGAPNSSGEAETAPHPALPAAEDPHGGAPQGR